MQLANLNVHRLDKVSLGLFVLYVIKVDGLEAVLEFLRQPGNILMHEGTLAHESLLVSFKLFLLQIGDLDLNHEASHEFASDVLGAAEALELTALYHNAHLRGH